MGSNWGTRRPVFFSQKHRSKKAAPPYVGCVVVTVVLRKRATVLYVIMKVVGQIFQDVVVGAAQRPSYLPGNPLVLVFLRAGDRGRAVDADKACVKINRAPVISCRLGRARRELFDFHAGNDTRGRGPSACTSCLVGGALRLIREEDRHASEAEVGGEVRGAGRSARSTRRRAGRACA